MAISVSKNPELAKTIGEWRKVTNRTRLALARELGVSKTAVSNWEYGQNQPNVDVILKLAGLAEGDHRAYFLIQAKNKSGLTTDAIQSIVGSANPRALKEGGRSRNPMVTLPLVAGLAGAGPPHIQDVEIIEGVLSVPKDICPSPADTRCIRVRGKSMEPTICDGTIAAVDGSQRRTEKLIGKVVAAWHEAEGVVVKRLVRVEGLLRLASDNHGYDAHNFEDGWQVVGRVIWWVQKG